MSAALQTTHFDYTLLPPEISTLAAAARRIRARLQASIVDTGRDLANVKAGMEHGQFGAWLAAEFDMSERTAQRYMSAARLADGKSDTLADLPAATLYVLAASSTPEPVQQAIIARVQAGERVDALTVREAVREAAEERRQAAIAPGAKKKAEAAERRRKARMAQQDAEWKAEADAAKTATKGRAEKAASLLLDRLSTADLENLHTAIAAQAPGVYVRPPDWAEIWTAICTMRGAA